jgi:hypothetical protein
MIANASEKKYAAAAHRPLPFRFWDNTIPKADSATARRFFPRFLNLRTAMT